ncbi:MAG: hypothetical protein GQ475_00945 [Methylococcaceae bacterium]|nr:hypothetical protein [Methylococcaceae bacterium]
MTEKFRVNVQEAGLVVGLGKSKRLSAMRQAIEPKVNVEPTKSKVKPNLNKNETAIQQARELITQKIAEIKAAYPQGRQNKLFALRYGSEDKLNQLSLKQLFTLLKMTEYLAKDISDVMFLEGSE